MMQVGPISKHLYLARGHLEARVNQRLQPLHQPVLAGRCRGAAARRGLTRCGRVEVACVAAHAGRDVQDAPVRTSALKGFRLQGMGKQGMHALRLPDGMPHAETPRRGDTCRTRVHMKMTSPGY